MCGRYTNHVEKMHSWTVILDDWPSEAVTGFNITPSQMIPAFTPSGGFALRWGMIPNWSKEASNKYATFNARIETVAHKPTFRHAWKQGQRCIIPAMGYYEWKTESGGKQPYYIRAKDQEIFAFAGLYEPARASIPGSCTVLTRPATADMKHLHPRMPVMLNRQDINDWYSYSIEDAEQLALTTSGPSLEVFPVSRAVNSPRNQGEELIMPIASVLSDID